MSFQQALALHRQGRTDEAGQAYQSVLLTEPTHLDALIHLGVLRLGQGQIQEAETLLRRAVTVSPGSPEALGNLATALQGLGRHEEAVTTYERALDHAPEMHDVRLGLAGCLQACGRDEAAIACYEALLSADPAHPEANYGLASVLARCRRTDAAIEKYRAALAADPDFAEAAYALGKVLAGGVALEEAVIWFRQALDVDPGYVEARAALGTALSRLYRDDEAMEAFGAILQAEPDHPDALNGIGTVLDRQRRHADAAEQFRAVLAHYPDNVDAMAGLATALKNSGRHAEAHELAKKVIAVRPDYPPALSLLGSILAELGSIDEALALFRRAVILAPNRPEYAYYLVELAKVRPGDQVIDALEAMVGNIDAYPSQEQCLLRFALAKAHDDIGQRDVGFAHLLRGNAAKRGRTNYKEAATLSGLERIARVFTPELMTSRTGVGNPSTVPIFIVGMPRSGTTLVEQILASHPDVHGAGERNDLSQVVNQMSAQRIGGTGFPEAVWTLDAETLHQMGTLYVAALNALAPGAPRIVDKMPANFALCGMIRLILPNAKIIHVSRDPVDTCLSIFSKLFSGDQPFSYDLGELGRYYRAYKRLMDHWRRVLPAHVMLDVEYESLVRDLEVHARRIVAHCDLPWNPTCLEFHKTERPVHTASLVQVRQPIYRTSVGRWRPTPDLLQALLDGFGDETRMSITPASGRILSAGLSAEGNSG